VGDVADYDQLFEMGSLRLVSMVEFDNLAVRVPIGIPGSP
jgi:hypothetical protein